MELVLDLEPAGRRDDLERTIDYSAVFDDLPPDRRDDVVPPDRGARRAIADEVLAAYHPDEVTVRIRKPAVDLGGTFRAVGIEIVRRRDARTG